MIAGRPQRSQRSASDQSKFRSVDQQIRQGCSVSFHRLRTSSRIRLGQLCARSGHLADSQDGGGTNPNGQLPVNSPTPLGTRVLSPLKILASAREGVGMRRREFITLLGSGVAWPLAAHAQQPGRMHQIGVLMGVTERDPDARPRIAAFEQALQDLGWINTRNIRIDYRWPTGDTERMQKLAKDIVESGSEIVVATGTAWVVALLRETSATPIVFVLVSDPVENGFVASLSQPGGNVTGFSNLRSEEHTSELQSQFHLV